MQEVGYKRILIITFIATVTVIVADKIGLVSFIASKV